MQFFSQTLSPSVRLVEFSVSRFVGSANSVCSMMHFIAHLSLHFLGFIGACLADIMMNWSLLFSDLVTENGKKHRHATVLIVLLLDIVLNCIIGLTPYVDNFSRKCSMLARSYSLDYVRLQPIPTFVTF